ncbi:hypothetical protein Sango_0253100 [Sesamum angolense]|uniref:DDE Tnp4 domain-containing protein n=1 Tax=Sesamum angolense TaxID=2727404 RepID=A0AAE2C7F0_9LAMI|nr:hypothetical protein Sango_0253100 [Sesamum angolense]
MNRWMALNRAVVGHEMSTRIQPSLKSPPMTSPDEYFSSSGLPQTPDGPSGSGRRFRRVASELQAKKCETMDRLNESLQGKIDRTNPKATESIERRTTTTAYMASSGVSGGLESNSAGESPGTPGTSGNCVGAMDGTLVPAWVPRVDQHRYRSRKDRLAQNVLAICDFKINFTYVHVGWEESAADACVLDNAVSQYPNFSFPSIGKYYLVDAGFTNYQCFLAPYRGTKYHLPKWRGQGRRYRTPQDMFNHAHSRFSNDDIILNELDEDTPIDIDSFYHIAMAFRRYLESVGFPQEDHWTLNVEQCFMWMILDENTRAPMRDDARAETQMGHWAHRLRRHFRYPYTRDQGDTQNAKSSNIERSPVRGGEDAPIVISDSTAPSIQSHTHIASWDAIEHVACDDGGPWLARSTSLVAQCSLDMGLKVGGYWIVV